MPPTAIPATFAAGCFWGTEHFYMRRFRDAIVTHAVGYMGGKNSAADNTVTYEQVKTGATGHAEVFHITYDPEKTTYDDLLDFFFRIHNPTTLNRQQGDVGTQYRSAVFYHNEEQKEKAEKKIAQLNGADPELRSKFVAGFGGDKALKVVTAVEPAGKFFEAEKYHQDYLEKNPSGYCSHHMYW